MANVSRSNLTSKVLNTMVDQELTFPFKVSYITNIIFNSIACPFTVLLKVLVILAVKSRPRLQSKPNILLACLAATDAMNGLAAQPTFIFTLTLTLLRINNQTLEFSIIILNLVSRALFVCSALHLMLVTSERLVAIKFTMHYPYIVTNRNIKLTVIAFWIVCLSSELVTLITNQTIFSNALTGFVLMSCVILFFFLTWCCIEKRDDMKIRSKPDNFPKKKKRVLLKKAKRLKQLCM